MMIPCTRVTAYRLFVSLMLVVVMMTLGTSVLSAQQSGLEQTSQLRVDGPPAPTPPQVITRDATGMEATVRAVRVESPIRIDGVLDEVLYRDTPSISGFVQSVPIEGAPATEQTEAWISFDEGNIYVSALSLIHI